MRAMCTRMLPATRPHTYRTRPAHGRTQVDIENLFNEFDKDGSGTIEYTEMVSALREADTKARELQIKRRPAVPPMPQLPSHLGMRKRDIWTIHEQFTSGLTDFSRRSHEGGGVGSASIMTKVARDNTPTFEAALRQFYPKDDRVTTATMARYVEGVIKTRAAADFARMREADERLLNELDEDGNGSISVSEFCGLSKVMGLSQVRNEE